MIIACHTNNVILRNNFTNIWLQSDKFDMPTVRSKRHIMNSEQHLILTMRSNPTCSLKMGIAIGYFIKQMEDIRYVISHIHECVCLFIHNCYAKNMEIISWSASFNLYNLDFMNTRAHVIYKFYH